MRRSYLQAVNCTLAIFLLAGGLAAPIQAREEVVMAKVVISPSAIPATSAPRIFLGGSIDMGSAEDWQKTVIDALRHEPVVILNPRRKEWDPAWKPELSDPHFKEQVEWELSALEQSDIIVMVLTPGSKSPVSLLELGLYARSGRLIVLCPPGYWRKGNVDAVTARYRITSVNSMDDLLRAVRARLALPHSP